MSKQTDTASACEGEAAVQRLEGAPYIVSRAGQTGKQKAYINLPTCPACSTVSLSWLTMLY